VLGLSRRYTSEREELLRTSLQDHDAKLETVQSQLR
jgi:hypothetical protein